MSEACCPPWIAILSVPTLDTLITTHNKHALPFTVTCQGPQAQTNYHPLTCIVSVIAATLTRSTQCPTGQHKQCTQNSPSITNAQQQVRPSKHWPNPPSITEIHGKTAAWKALSDTMAGCHTAATHYCNTMTLPCTQHQAQPGMQHVQAAFCNDP